MFEKLVSTRNVVAAVVGFVIAISGFYGFNYYQDHNYIIKNFPKLEGQEQILKHDVLVGAIPFGNEVQSKLVNGVCSYVSEPEKKAVIEDLLKNRKVIQWHMVINRYNDSTNHNGYIINKNLVKDQNDPDFVSMYFTSTYFCEAYKTNTDRYLNTIKNRYDDANFHPGN